MLKSWSIQNFKAIVDSGNLKLAPVTVLAGRNSSGKSSLLQSILMISQTLSNPINERALVTNGTLVQLGTFTDVLSDFSDSEHMVFNFELKHTSNTNIPNSLVHQVSVSFASGSNTNTSAIEAAKVIVDNVSMKTYSSAALPSLNNKMYGNVQHSLIITQATSREQEHFYPKNYDMDRRNYIGESELKLGLSQLITPRKLTIILYHFLPGATIGNFSEVGDSENDTANIKYITESTDQINHFFTSQIRYLGPLRADPSIVQQKFSPFGDFDDVGFKGEYAATVYDANQLATIEYYNPTTKQVEQAILQNALDTWAKHLEVADQVKTEVAGTSGVMWRITLKQGQKSRSLPQIGVGVSQILPILVMGLLSPKGSLLIIEQPELHLHARVQALLGDFFVGLSKCNKQCLIETHSENLVSQLRLHIVQSGGLEDSDCMIYFVDQDEQGAAKFEEVEISKNGNILNWPDGFFDETMRQEDRITAASIRRRAGEAKSTKKHG